MSEGCDTTDLRAPTRTLHHIWDWPCLFAVVCFHVIVLLWFGLHKFFLFYSCCLTFLHKLKIQNDISVDMQTFYL